MPLFRYLSTVLTAAGLLLLLAPVAPAADFSESPFASSERALMNLRASTTLLNLSAKSSQPASPTNIIIRQSLPARAVDDTNTSAGLFNPYYGGWGRRWISPFYGSGYGAGSLAAPYAFVPSLGGWGYRGYRGFSGLGGWRGYGSGWGGWSSGAAGAFGNWMDYDGMGDLGSFGYVFNGTPSKASGNYYAPSTKDPSAAGNYYAGDSSAVNMPIKPYTTPKDYWGSSGSPLPENINKVPW